MSQPIIDQLGKQFELLLKAIGQFRKDVNESLQHLRMLPKHIEGLREEINQSTKNQINARGEMEVHVRLADMTAQKQLLLGENEAIQDFKKQLEEDFQRINDRYKQIDDKLNNECLKRIRELDAHLLDLPDSFPKNLIQCVTERINPLLNHLLIDANVSYQERVEYLQSIANATSSTIQKFVTSRKELSQTVDSYQQAKHIESDKDFYIPLWIIETSDTKNGKKQANLFFPGTFTDNNSDSAMEEYIFECDYPIKKLYDLLNSDTTKQRLLDRVKWENGGEIKQKLLSGIKEILKLQNKSEEAVIKAYDKFIEKSSIEIIK